MLAFYACTNTQIINMINVKEQYYHNEDADLYILKKNRVDLDLMKCVEEAKIFNSIVFIEPYVLPQNALYKIFNLFIAHSPNRYYRNCLLKVIGSKIYNKFLTFGFWTDALYVFDAFYKKNHNIEVEFVEEGIINYFFGIGRPYFCRTYGGIKEKCIRLLAHGVSSFRLKINITNMYVYRPDLVSLNYYIELKRINNQRDIISRLTKAYELKKQGITAIYEKTKIVYLLDNYEIDTHINILKNILRDIQETDLLIKLHPENSKKDVIKIYSAFPNIRIDDKNYCFEMLMIGQEGIKAFLSRASTFVYNFNFIFGVRKHNLLFYRLFKYKNKNVIDFGDKFFNAINKNNIIIINDFKEINQKTLKMRDAKNGEEINNSCK